MKNAETADRKWAQGCALEDEGKIGEAIEVYRIAVRMGSEEAMSNLGNLLDDKIVPPRPREAVYWYKRALKRGLPSAAWNLAMHYKILGKRRWYIYWLQVAAKLGDSDAVDALRKLIH